MYSLIKYYKNVSLIRYEKTPCDLIVRKPQHMALLCLFEDKNKNLLIKLQQCEIINNVLVFNTKISSYLLEILTLLSYTLLINKIDLKGNTLSIPLHKLNILINRDSKEMRHYFQYIYLLTMLVKRICINLEILLRMSKYIYRVSVSCFSDNNLIGKKFVLLKKEEINSYLLFTRIVSTPIFSRKRLKPNLSEDSELIQHLRERLDSILHIITYKYLSFDKYTKDSIYDNYNLTITYEN